MQPPLASSKTLDTSRSHLEWREVNTFRYIAHCRSGSVRSSGRTPIVLCYRRLVMSSQREPLRVRTPYRKHPGPCPRDEDEHIRVNGAAEVGLRSAGLLTTLARASRDWRSPDVAGKLRKNLARLLLESL